MDYQNPYNYDPYRQKRDIPNATAVLVLGILSIPTCICYGIVGIILSIVALVLSSSASRAYNTSPELYTTTSKNNLNAGRVCAIIGLILSILFLVMVVLLIITKGLHGISNYEYYREFR